MYFFEKPLNQHFFFAGNYIEIREFLKKYGNYKLKDNKNGL